MFSIFKPILLERLIENGIKSWMQKKRPVMVNDKMIAYEAKHADASESFLLRLRDKLESETSRVSAFADHSILRTGILQARYRFWIVLAVSMLFPIISGAMGITSFSNLLVMLSPPAVASATWLATLVGIPVGYIERLNGGMKSVIHSELRKQVDRDELTSSYYQLNAVIPLTAITPPRPQLVTPPSSPQDVIIDLSHHKDQLEENSRSQYAHHSV